MRDLAIDPVTGDLAISNGAASLTDGVVAVAQRLKIRLGLWQGEYPLDLSIGIPYAQTLGTKATATRAGGPARLERILRAAAQTCPGVASLQSFVMTLDANRQAIVSLVARAITGEPITLNDYFVGTL